MGWFGKGSDCTLTNFNSRLKELEIRPIRELHEIKRDIVEQIVGHLDKTEERLEEKLSKGQKHLYHIVEKLEGRIRTLEAKEHFKKTGKGSKK